MKIKFFQLLCENSLINYDWTLKRIKGYSKWMEKKGEEFIWIFNKFWAWLDYGHHGDLVDLISWLFDINYGDVDCLSIKKGWWWDERPFYPFSNNNNFNNIKLRNLHDPEFKISCSQ